jgi:hypothetical protein
VRKPNYDFPTKGEYQYYLNGEGFLTQTVEVLKSAGEINEARLVLQEKKLTRNRRICLAAALNKTTKIAASSTTELTAVV